MSKTFSANTVTDPKIIALEERTEVLDGYSLPNPIYVSPDGSDETGDGTEQNPFREIQHAIDVIPSTMVQYQIIIDEGSYNRVSTASYGKMAKLSLRGNIEINAQNGRGFSLYYNNNIELVSFDSTNKDITFTNCNDVIILANIHSSILIPNNINIKFTNCTGNVFTSSHNSVIRTYATLNYVGSNNTIDTVFSAIYGGNLFFLNGTSSNNVGSLPSGGTFAKGLAGAVCIISSPITINNKFTYGLDAEGGFILINITGNNSPTRQIHGGRIFSGSSSSTLSVRTGNELMEYSYSPMSTDVVDI